MYSRTKLKQSAKIKLKDNLKLCIITFLVYYLIIRIFTYTTDSDSINLVLTLASFLLFGPLQIGANYFTFKICNSEPDVSFKDLFSGFRIFDKSCLLYLVCFAISFIGTLVFIIPGIIALCALSQSFYLLAEDNTLSVTDCIKKSCTMMKGHKMDLFILGLSFLGWIILGVVTFGIGFLWVYPYIAITNCNFHLLLKENTALN